MLLREIKDIFHAELRVLYTREESAHLFYNLLEHHLGMERFILVLQPRLTLSKAQEQPLFEALVQLREGKPLQYVLGETQFMGLRFLLSPAVLIPRPETEELVRWVLKEHKDAGTERILDIGSGSGCIAVSLASFLPETRVTALEISAPALEICRENARLHGLKLQFLQADVLQLKSLPETYDVMVSNPPYVRASEKNGMAVQVLAYEPATALFVPDSNPLLFYERISTLAETHLKPGGALYFELSEYMGREVEILLQDRNFSEIEVRKDMFGKPRMIRAIRKA